MGGIGSVVLQEVPLSSPWTPVKLGMPRTEPYHLSCLLPGTKLARFALPVLNGLDDRLSETLAQSKSNANAKRRSQVPKPTSRPRQWFSTKGDRCDLVG